MIRTFFKKLRNNQIGATAIEYGLIAALVSVVLIGALNTMGTSLTGMFDGVSTAMDNANTPAGGGGSS